MEYQEGFEGAEKTLELEFNPLVPEGMRALTKEQVEQVLTLAGCQALSCISNGHYDAYVLSESSLFISPERLILKTCGQTSLLLCIPYLLQVSAGLAEIECVYFSRKGYLFPDKQPHPHTSWESEVAYLDRFFSDGQAFLMGSQQNSHWHLYIAKAHNRQTAFQNQTLEVLMWDIDPDVLKMFVCGPHNEGLSAKDITAKSGIGDILPGAQTDEHVFQPCGYSVNGLTDDGAYFTIHITPEPHCNFISFETDVDVPDTTKLVNKVIDTFKPGEFTIAIYADSNSAVKCADRAYKGSPSRNGKTYRLVSRVVQHVRSEFSFSVNHFEMPDDDGKPQPFVKKQPSTPSILTPAAVKVVEAAAPVQAKTATAETKKVTAETKKVTAETKKVTAETKKVTAETKKVTAETKRLDMCKSGTAAPVAAKEATVQPRRSAPWTGGSMPMPATDVCVDEGAVVECS